MLGTFLQNTEKIAHTFFENGIFDYSFNLFLILLVFVDVWENRRTGRSSVGTAKNTVKEKFVKDVSVIIFLGYIVLLLSKFFENTLFFILLIIFIIYMLFKFMQEGILWELIEYIKEKINI